MIRTTEAIFEDGVLKPVLGLVGQLVRLLPGESIGDGKVDLGVKRVADPAQPDPLDGSHVVNREQRRLGPVDQPPVHSG